MRHPAVPVLLAAMMACAGLSSLAAPPVGGAPKIGFYVGDFEQVVIAHMTGSKKKSVSELRQRRERLSSVLDSDADSLPNGEYRDLKERLRKVDVMISASEKLGDKLDAKLEAAMRGAAAGKTGTERLDALALVSSQLLKAASTVDAGVVKRVFDGLRRHFGDVKGLDAVRADLSSPDREPIEYTPPDDPRIKTRALTAPPAPASEPRGPIVQERDASWTVAAKAALAPILRRMPNGDQKQFLSARRQKLAELTALAQAALGDKAEGMSLAAMVERLGKSGANFGLTARSTNAELLARLRRLKAANEDLAKFAAALLVYRREFLSLALDAGSIPIGTQFQSWEFYPSGQDAARIEAAGFTYKGTEFIGVRITRKDGSSLFKAADADHRRGIEIAKDRLGATVITAYDFDGSGKITSKTVEKLDQDGNVRLAARTTEDQREVRVFDGTGPQLQIDRINPDHTLTFKFRVLPDGSKLEQASKHIKRLIKDGATAMWDVDVLSLPEDGGKERQAAALALAKETLKMIKEDDADGRKAKAFADFLYHDAVIMGAVSKHGKDPAMRLTISAGEPKIFTLVLQNQDGSRKVFTGFFGVSSTPSKLPAFLVQNESEFDAHWHLKNAANPEAQKKAARVAYEFLGGGEQIFRNDPHQEKDVSAYGPADATTGYWNGAVWAFKRFILHPIGNQIADTRTVTYRSFQRRVADPSVPGGWRNVGQPWETTSDRVEEGTAPALGYVKGFFGIPGISHVVGGCNWVGNFLYTGAVNLGESAYVGVTQSDLAVLNSVSTRARNPAWAYHIAGHQPDGRKDPAAFEAWAKKIIAELTPGARRILDQTVMNMRPERVSKFIDPQDSPVYYQKAIRLPPTAMEEYFTMLSEFGAGNYGKELARRGHTWLGAGVSGAESIAQMACNPMTWVVPFVLSKLGQLPAFCERMAAAAKGGGKGWMAFKKVADWGHFMAIGSVTLPFGMSMAHDLLEGVNQWGTENGSALVGQGVADLLFLGGMGHRGLRETTLGRRLTKFFKRGEGAPEMPGGASDSGALAGGDGAPAPDLLAAGDSGTSATIEATSVGTAPADPLAGHAPAGGARTSAPHSDPAGRTAAEPLADGRAPGRPSADSGPTETHVDRAARSHAEPPFVADASAPEGPASGGAEPPHHRNFAASENSGPDASTHGRSETAPESADPASARSSEPGTDPARVSPHVKGEDPVRAEPEAPPEGRVRRWTRGLRDAARRFVEEGGPGGAIARAQPIATSPVANKPEDYWKVDPPVIPKKEARPPVDKPTPQEKNPPRKDSPDKEDLPDPNRFPDRKHSPRREDRDRKEEAPAPGGGGGGGGVIAAAPPERHAPNVKLPGGGKGGSGGGGGAGGGNGGAGSGGAPNFDGSKRAGGGGPAQAGPSAPPPAAQPGGSAGAPSPSRAPAASPARGAIDGGHAPDEAVAHGGQRKYDGAPGAPGLSSMSGLSASHQGLSNFAPHNLFPGAARPAGAAGRRGAAEESSAPATEGRPAEDVAQNQDDFDGFTPLAPARHRYPDLADDGIKKGNWRALAAKAAPAAGLLGGIYLFEFSEFGYLLGFARRRRKIAWTTDKIETA